MTKFGHENCVQKNCDFVHNFWILNKNTILKRFSNELLKSVTKIVHELDGYEKLNSKIIEIIQCP